MTGTLDNPAMQLFGTLHAGRIKNYPLDRIDLNVALRNNVLTIQDFQARQGTGLMIAKGTADLKGPLALEIGGKNIDAGLLAAWLDTKAEIQGKMDFLAQLGGTAAAPARIHRERDFGVGYGSSSGYGSNRHYASSSATIFRCR